MIFQESMNLKNTRVKAGFLLTCKMQLLIYLSCEKVIPIYKD